MGNIKKNMAAITFCMPVALQLPAGVPVGFYLPIKSIHPI
jgi:hypothetical protein